MWHAWVEGRGVYRVLAESPKGGRISLRRILAFQIMSCTME
jgi:hypothetical protein